MNQLPGVKTDKPLIRYRTGYVHKPSTKHAHDWKPYNKLINGALLKSWYCKCGKVDVYEMERVKLDRDGQLRGGL